MYYIIFSTKTIVLLIITGFLIIFKPSGFAQDTLYTNTGKSLFQRSDSLYQAGKTDEAYNCFILAAKQLRQDNKQEQYLASILRIARIDITRGDNKKGETEEQEDNSRDLSSLFFP